MACGEHKEGRGPRCVWTGALLASSLHLWAEHENDDGKDGDRSLELLGMASI